MRYFKNFFKQTWRPQQILKPFSRLDLPVVMADAIYQAGPDPERNLFPLKNRIPRTHMENPSRFEPMKATGLRNIGETELHEVKTIVATASVATSTREQTNSIPCKNGGCKNWTSHGTPESPWHRLKTIFLVSVIVALVVWVIVYALLAQYHIL